MLFGQSPRHRGWCVGVLTSWAAGGVAVLPSWAGSGPGKSHGAGTAVTTQGLLGGFLSRQSSPVTPET